MLTDEQREYQRNWYWKNVESRRMAARETMRKWRKENPTQARLACKKWRDKNLKAIRNGNRKRAYGLSNEDFDALFSSQGKLCAVCRGEATSEKHWHVDHCHITKKVRGVLCNHCNLMLGHAKDRLDVLEAAIKYLMPS